LVVPSFRNLLLAMAASVCTLAASFLPTSTGPAPALTGGFGETTCNVCHRDFALNEPGGVLQLDALPQFFEAGRSYELSIRLEHPELKRAGFQLSARFADGTSAGSFQVTDTSLLRVQQARGVQYLSHNLAGALVVTDHVARWRFRWVAPRSSQRVVFHVAANAANHDASEFGDRIYTASFYSEGSEPVKK
jgi:hypothetical protein